MKIGNAIQNGNFITVYDDKGNKIRFHTINEGDKGLINFTQNSYSIQQLSFIRIFDENGNVKQTINP